MAKDTQPPAHWENVQETLTTDCRVFQVYTTKFRHPVDKREGDFFVLHCNDWVQAIPLTPDNELIMVNQYRFGSENLSWEVPGGIIDDEDPSPIVAAERELLEETGYKGENPKIIGSCHSNPAIIANRSHFVLIENCQLVEQQNLDEHEELQVKRIPLPEVYNMALTGQITHSIALNAIFMLKEHLKQ